MHRDPSRRRTPLFGCSRLVAVAVATLSLLAGCGPPSRLPGLPAAPEPAVAPPVTTRPAGTVMDFLDDTSAPEGVAADPRTGVVAVALRHPDRLAIVNASTLQVQRLEFVPGRARHLVLERPGGPVILPGEDTNEVLQIALPSGRILTSTPVGKQPHNASYADGRIYVADELGSAVDVIDAVTGTVLATLPGPVQPGGTAVVDGVISAVDVRGARLYTWSQRTLKPLGTLKIGSGPTHETEIGDGLLLIADTRGSRLLLVDPVRRRIVGSISLPGTPYGLTSDPAAGRAWVSLTATNQVVAVQRTGDSLVVTHRWPTVQQPNTLSWDAADDCLFIAGDTRAQLERICHAS